MNSILLNAIPSSPAGEQLRWYLELLIFPDQGPADGNPAHYTPELWKRIYGIDEPKDVRERWRGWSARIGTITGLNVEVAEELSIKALVVTGKQHEWWLSLEVEAHPPHRITKIDWQRKVAFKLEVRKATEADGQALAEIEQHCPIVLGDTSIYFDRSDDYFAFTRLMEEATIGIAFVDDEPAAASCAAIHKVRIGGVIHPILTIAHLRVMPEYQRKGLWGAVNRAFDHYWKNVDGSNAFISMNNVGMQHGFINTPNKWSIAALCFQLSCGNLAGPPFGRVAVPSDAEHIVRILNATHEREELYVRYTAETLIARLQRAPEQYSWPQILMTDRAIVGVLVGSHSLKVITISQAERTVYRRGLVLDYGFLPGAEDELEELLRAWCGVLVAGGVDTLSMFSSEPSPGYARIRTLASAIEPFNMWTPGIAEPSDSVTRGLYVDPVYF